MQTLSEAPIDNTYFSNLLTALLTGELNAQGKGVLIKRMQDLKKELSEFKQTYELLYTYLSKKERKELQNLYETYYEVYAPILQGRLPDCYRKEMSDLNQLQGFLQEKTLRMKADGPKKLAWNAGETFSLQLDFYARLHWLISHLISFKQMPTETLREAWVFYHEQLCEEGFNFATDIQQHPTRYLPIPFEEDPSQVQALRNKLGHIESSDERVSLGVVELNACPLSSEIPMMYLGYWLKEMIRIKMTQGLTSLSLRKCQIGQGSLQEQGIGRQVKVLEILLRQHRSRLQELDLSKNGFTAAEMTRLLSVLELCVSLHDLDLSGNSLKSDHVAHLARLIEQPAIETYATGGSEVKFLESREPKCHFESLRLSACGLTDQKVDVLIQALHSNTYIIEIDLSGNPLTDISLQKFVQLLDVNHSLETVILHKPSEKSDVNNNSVDLQYSVRLLQTLEQKLEANKAKKEHMLEGLTSSESLFDQAKMAIRMGEVKALQYYCGLGMKNAVYRYNKQHSPLFIQERKANLTFALVEHQINVLKLARGIDWNDTKQVQQLLDQDQEARAALRKAEIAAIREHYERTGWVERGGELISATQTLIEEEIGKYVKDQLDPRLEALDLDLTSSVNFKSLIESRQATLERAKQRLEVLHEARDLLQKNHAEREKAYEALKLEGRHLGLRFRRQAPKQERIIERLLESQLNLNQRDEKGDTLLHIAFQENQPEALAYLLKQGANPFLKNGQGESLFNQALLEEGKKGKAVSSVRRDCCRKILEHVTQTPVSQLFPALIQERLVQEAQRLNKGKEIADEYCQYVLLEGIRSSFIFRILFLGGFWHVEDRMQDVHKIYQWLDEVAQFENKYLIQQYQQLVKDIIEKAKRGFWGTSQLHDALFTWAKGAQDELASYQREYEKVFEAAWRREKELGNPRASYVVQSFEQAHVEKQVQQLIENDRERVNKIQYHDTKVQAHENELHQVKSENKQLKEEQKRMKAEQEAMKRWLSAKMGLSLEEQAKFNASLEEDTPVSETSAQAQKEELAVVVQAAARGFFARKEEVHMEKGKQKIEEPQVSSYPSANS